jgi:hypothetical protein
MLISDPVRISAPEQTFFSALRTLPRFSELALHPALTRLAQSFSASLFTPSARSSLSARTSKFQFCESFNEFIFAIPIRGNDPGGCVFSYIRCCPRFHLLTANSVGLSLCLTACDRVLAVVLFAQIAVPEAPFAKPPAAPNAAAFLEAINWMRDGLALPRFVSDGKLEEKVGKFAAALCEGPERMREEIGNLGRAQFAVIPIPPENDPLRWCLTSRRFRQIVTSLDECAVVKFVRDKAERFVCFVSGELESAGQGDGPIAREKLEEFKEEGGVEGFDDDDSSLDLQQALGERGDRAILPLPATLAPKYAASGPLRVSFRGSGIKTLPVAAALISIPDRLGDDDYE